MSESKPNYYLSSLRIYNRALTLTEIEQLYNEFHPEYQIVADDQSFSLYQKQESYTITYGNPVATAQTSFEIVEGSLPSSITFNNSTGTFTGKGLTDADHVYNLKVKISSSSEIVAPTTINVTINTYKTARISITAKTHEYITNVMPQTSTIPYTSDEPVTFQLKSGTLPTGITFNASLPGFVYDTTYITQDINTSVVINGYSEHNQTGVDSTQIIIVRKNAIQSNNQTFIFYPIAGQSSRTVSYSGSLAPVQDATFALSGTLPLGVTFNTSTGVFTSDGTQTTSETKTVQVTISSINNISTSKTIEVTLTIDASPTAVDPIVNDGLVFFQPFNVDYITPQIGYNMTFVGTAPTLTTVDGVSCVYFDGQQYMYDNTHAYWDDPSDTGPSATFACWINFPGDAGERQPVVTFGLGMSASRNPRTCIYCSYPRRLEHLLTGNKAIDILNPYTTNQWYHLAIVNDNWNHYCYLNGVLHDTIYRELRVSPPFIGIMFDGVTTDSAIPVETPLYMSRFKIYNRALSASEVLQLAQEFN